MAGETGHGVRGCQGGRHSGRWLGPTGLAIAAVAAVFLAALLGGLAMAAGAIKRHQPVPFVPFLAAGGTLIWFTGSPFWLSLVLGQG